MRINTLIRVLAAAALVAACGGESVTGPPPTPVPTQLSLSTQPSSAAQNGAPLTTQPAVRLRDANGIIVAKSGVVVTATSTGSLVLANATATTDGNGTATFNGLTGTGLVGSYTLTFSASGLTAVSSSAITLSAGPASQLVVTSQPSTTAQAGIALAQQPAVQLRDVSGNDAAQAGVTVTATLVTGSAAVGNATAVSGAGGVAVFTGLTLSGGAGAYTLRFSANGISAADAAAATTLAAGPATQLALTTAPSASAVNGTAFAVQPVVQLRDAFGNNATQAGTVVVASVVSGPGGSAIAGDTATTNASGTAAFAGLKLTGLAGSYGLRFASSGFSSVVGVTALTAGAAKKLGLTTAPSGSPQSGIAFATQPVVQVQDSSGNAVAQAGVVVHAGVTGATLANDSATTDAAGKATFSGLMLTGTATIYTLNFTAAGLTAVNSAPIVLNAGVASQLVLTTQPATTAQGGVALTRQPVARLLDASGNVVSQAGVVVTATVVSGTVTLASATATTVASGTATFAGLSLAGVVGSYTLRFSAPSVTSIDASAPTVLSAGAATQLGLTTQPATSVSSGSALAPQPVVQLRDASGNPATGAGVVVTASLVSGAATLTNATATTNASGTATFAGLTLTGVAANYTLRFTAPALTQVDAAAATALGAGPATQLAVSTEPATTAASSVALTTQPVVQLKDGAGNSSPQAGVIITATVVSGSATFTNSTATTDAAGAATFSNLAIVATAGSYTLRFTSGGLTAANAAAPTVVSAGPATQLSFATAPPATAQVAVALSPAPAIQLRDGASNPAPQSGIVVTASVVSGAVTLANATATTNASGVATFSTLTLSAVTGSYTLRFSAPGLGTLDAPAPTALSAGPATQLAVTTQPSLSVAVGAAMASQPALQLQDVAGNPTPQAGVLVTASVVSGSVTFTNGTATTNASGLATFSGLSLAGLAGSYTLRFSAPSVTSIDASAPTVLSAGTANGLVVATQPATGAQSAAALAPQPVVQLRDASGNATAGAGVVVTASVISGTATVTNATATTNASGAATFAGLTLTGVAGSYTLRFTAPGLTQVDAAAATVLGAGIATQLAVSTEPATTAASSVALTTQPVVQLKDGAGNASPQAGVIITATVVSGSATFTNGTATTDAAGAATFSNLAIVATAGSYTLRFTSGGLTAADAAAPTVVSAGPATQLAVSTEPATTAASSVALTTQPVVQLKDGAGNPSPQAGVVVTATVVSGSATLTNATATTDAAGAATFSNLAIVAPSGSYTLRFTSGSLTAVNAAAPTVVSAGPATQLSFATAPPAAAQVGVALSPAPAIQLLDGANNPSPQSGTVVTATVVSGAVTLANATATTNASGVATFSTLTLSAVPGSYTLRFAAPGLGTLDAPAPTALAVGPATQLAVVTEPATTAASGVVLTTQPVVQLKDGAGNLAPQAGVVVTATVVSGSATFTNGTATTDAAGTATFSNLAIVASAGSYTIQFTSGSLTAANAAAPTVVGAGPATQLSFATAPPAGAQVGVALSPAPAIQLLDGATNPAPQSGIVVTASVISGAVTLTNATATTNVSGVATFSTLTLSAVPGSYTLRFTAPGLGTLDAPAPTALTVGPATQLTVSTQPSVSVAAGAALASQPELQLRDAAGNPAPQSGVLVTASVVSGSVTFTNGTATTNASGLATFSGLSFVGLAGSYTLRFSAPSVTSIDASAPTVLSAGVAAALSVATQPATSALSDAALAPQPVVQLHDASGNAATGAGVVVTASLVSGTATLTNATATTNAAGTATFAGLTLTGVAANYTLRFTAPALTQVDAAAATALGAGPATQLAVSTEPATTAASSVALTTQPVVQLKDGAGNSSPQAGVIITATVVSGSATFTNSTATTDAAGAATFSNLAIVATAGSYTLRFTSGGLTAANAAAPTVVSAGPATQLSFATAPPATAQVAVALSPAPAIQLRDGASNPAPQSGIVVTASVVSGAVTLANATATTNASGIATFSTLTLSAVAGSYTLRFTAPGLGTLDAPAPTALTAGPATQLAVSTEPATTAASSVALTTQPVVQLKDGAGNASPQAGVLITATVVSGSATFTNGTATTNAAGVATFSNLAIVATAGSYTLRFTSGSLTAANAAAPTVVSAGPATQLSFATPPPATAQVAVALSPAPAIQLLDGAANPTPQSGIVVTASVVSGAVTLANATAITDINGVATFSTLALTAVTGSYTLRFTAPGLGTLDAPAPTALAAGAATQLAVSTQPSLSVAVGAAMASQPALQLQDVAGNPTPQSGVLVTASVVSGSVTFTNGTATTNTSGLATFSGLSLTGLAGPYTLRFSAPAVTSVDASAATNLTFGAATALSLTTQPATTANVGVALTTQPVAQLRDVAGNAVAQAGIVITATAAGATVANGTATTTASGVATFVGLSLSAPANASYLLSFSGTGLTSVDATLQTAVNPGAPATVTLLTAPPLNAVNNVAFSVTPSILVQDAAGNAVPSQVVHADASGATLANGASTTDALGVANFPGLVLTGQVSGYSLRFCAGTDCNNPLAIVISPTPTALTAGAPVTLTVTTQPSLAAQAGIVLAVQPVAHVVDVAGNPVSGVTVTATAGAAGVVNPTAITDASGDAAFSGLTLSGTVGSYTLHFATSGPSADAAAATVLSAGVAATVTVNTQPSSSATNGVVLAQQPVVTVLDASGNGVPSVTVTASTTVGASVNNPTATTNGSGVATFDDLALTGTAASYTLTFTSGAAVQTSNAIALGAGAPLFVSFFTAPPASAANGAAFSTTPVVLVTDGTNPIEGIVVTATAAGATVANATAVTDVSGHATFTGIALTGAPASYTVSFTAGTVAPATASVNLTAGTAALLAIVTPPSTTAQNAVALGVQPVVRITDAGGNSVAQSGTTITASLVSGSAVVGSATAITDVAGAATFSGLTLTGTVGSYTLRFSGPSLASVNAPAPTVVSAGAATKLAVVTQPSASAVVGTALPQQPVVQLQDVSGNAVPQSGVNVTAATDSFPATLAGTLTVATNGTGSATFTNLLVNATAGHRLFRFTSGALTLASAADTSVIAAPVTSGTPVPTGGTTDSESPYAITVPPGADSLVVTISDPTLAQTADLYVRFGAAPEPAGGPLGTGLYDCFPNQAGANETCKMVAPAAGTWYILVRAFPFSYSGVTLTARVY